jgi:hypothetical protein
MANLKYPGGLKVKAALGWFTAFMGGVGPFVCYTYTYNVKESYIGKVNRKIRGGDDAYSYNNIDNSIYGFIHSSDILFR